HQKTALGLRDIAPNHHDAARRGASPFDRQRRRRVALGEMRSPEAARANAILDDEPDGLRVQRDIETMRIVALAGASDDHPGDAQRRESTRGRAIAPESDEPCRNDRDCAQREGIRKPSEQAGDVRRQRDCGEWHLGESRSNAGIPGIIALLS
ncbi:MAG TPA: hypothetical protein VKP00_06430, partial [Gemmatimonadaceae bacterium]|nr:hypothetical protein [Gemmatimonadaceae bacterium]